MILCLETATNLCSVALCDKNRVVSLKESDERQIPCIFTHQSLLRSSFKKQGIKAGDLDAVAVSKGPGSYTGLRIGVSTAKGISYASSIPLIGVDTTLSMFSGYAGYVSKKYDIIPTDLFCPALDARRMEIYYSVFDAAGETIKSIRAEIMNEDSLTDIPESSRIFLFGDGAIKCREVITRKNILFDTDFRISASFMHKPAYEALINTVLKMSHILNHFI